MRPLEFLLMSDHRQNWRRLDPRQNILAETAEEEQTTTDPADVILPAANICYFSDLEVPQGSSCSRGAWRSIPSHTFDFLRHSSGREALASSVLLSRSSQ